jgi:BirA family biotin operon repressor/biotin-[acetyl-CoA-carboxylase] ligase
LRLDEVGSTNDWIRDQADRLADGQWVWAERQTGGRGRMGRPWQVLPGNLAASCLVRRRPGEGLAHHLAFVMAVAAFETAATFADSRRLMLKWPNDLLLDERKLGGILLETAGPEQVIAGVGVNLAQAPAVAGRSTAALGLAGEAPAPERFLEMLAEQFERWRRYWSANGIAALLQQWSDRAHPRGRRLSVTSAGGRVEGCYEGLGPDGSLLLADSAGAIRRLLAADVELLG